MAYEITNGQATSQKACLGFKNKYIKNIKCIVFRLFFFLNSFINMKAQLFSTALAFIANIALSQAFYSDRDDVLSLTTKNFGSAILDTDVSICNLYID
jgi:hypothetical protein